MIDIRDLRDLPEYIPIIEEETRKEFSEFPAARPIKTFIALVDCEFCRRQNKICASRKFAGAGSLSEDDLKYGMYSEKNPWIADFFIMKKYRGQGVARVLASYLVEIGLQQYPEIYIWTKNRDLAMEAMRSVELPSVYTEYLGNREYYENIIYIFRISRRLRQPEAKLI